MARQQVAQLLLLERVGAGCVEEGQARKERYLLSGEQIKSALTGSTTALSQGGGQAAQVMNSRKGFCSGALHQHS